MSADTSHDLPASAFEGVRPLSRELTLWTASLTDPDRTWLHRARRYMPHALVALVVLTGGYAAASLATAPALTDGVDEVSAIDARRMGLAAHLDVGGDQARAAVLNKDVSSLKAEIARLQKALSQAKVSQATLARASAGQAANNQDEVRDLKDQIAALNKTLETTRDAAAAKIDALQAKVDQPKPDDGRLAALQERLDRLEKAPAEKQAKRDPGPETTGSVSPPTNGVVRNWSLREVNGGVAVLEGRRGVIEVEEGARAPEIGRVRSIERRSGEWVVVTDRGLILQR